MKSAPDFIILAMSFDLSDLRNASVWDTPGWAENTSVLLLVDLSRFCSSTPNMYSMSLEAAYIW